MLTQEYVYNGLVTKVVDGDTIDVDVDLGFTVTVSVRFRLLGINTMEMKDPDPVKREKAQAAKQFVIEKILNKQISLKSHKTDKYGRWLAEVYINNELVNKMLLNEGLAVEYMV